MTQTTHTLEKDEDQSVLRYAGMMGHPVAVVRTLPDGRAVLGGEFNDVESAFRLSPDSRVYTRSGKKWLRVAYAAH